jgi:hypothetical protein
MSTTIKLQDTSPLIGNRSRQERYWQDRGFDEFYKQFRKGKTLSEKFHTVNSLEKLNETFSIRAVGFGNWVTQEDRFNYVSCLLISLHDIDEVVKFDNNIGLHKKVSMSFGARGAGKALAHFEPDTFIINITRYIDEPGTPKNIRFAMTGGAGSVAHEYGHALDYFFGRFRDTMAGSVALSMGRTTSVIVPMVPGARIRNQMNTLINKINSLDGKTKSPYRQRLDKAFSGDYIFRRNEIFARAFEQYVFYKLRKKGISNSFLHDTKYDSRAYMKEMELERVIPEMDYLISMFRISL